ncbi:hypothetical protein AK830_g6434 [Neonectria ditissima]|uniref:Carboxylic ester hydrolase n=1 Tax=Neonectria ditissima TaxID=78410 RepID=A0A0P7BJB3_9HYPO|nr:hypothetical protein AK830_g6434 [Neonectria ditissima]
MGKPLVFVSVQYRLNIFAFGDGVGSKNLALQDQALALHWIQDHISGFGGDPERVTLAGESAGAVYCHAHLVTGAPARQYILSSGSLHLSPPQPKEKASALRQSVQAQFDGLELRTVSVAAMVEAVKRSKIQSWFLEEDLRFKNWQNTTGSAQGLLISDVQNEAVLWREGIMSTDTEAIVSAFDLAGESSTELKRLYSIDSGRPSSSKLGALDFINDYKFVLPAEKLVEQWRAEQKPVFRCIIDEANPWQPSNGAHHAVDLILLFGGFDLSLAPKAQQTGANMRKQWIEFVHEEEPWSQNVHTAFGPHGVFQELDDDELRSRRRMAQVEFLGRTDGAILDKVFFALAAGKLSLLN